LRKGLSLVAVLILSLIVAFLPATSFAASSGVKGSEHALLLARQFGQRHAANSSNLVYNGGQVMSGTVNVYVVFWEPSGNVSSSYNSLIERYFNDVGGSALYKNNAQYTGPSGAPAGSTLAGTWVDTQAYPESPLLDSDIQNEVVRAQSTEGWTASLSTLFFVLTERNENICLNSSKEVCTSNTPETFCGYHNYFATDTIYAAIPYAASFSCKSGLSPNGDDADSTINVISREQMDAVTDPLLNAWYDASGNEIGDKCSWAFGVPTSQGSNVSWNNDLYAVQEEWSNALGNCTLGSSTPTYYHLVDAHSGQVLEVYHSSLTNGATVDQWPNNGSPTQMWAIVPDGAYYQIVNCNSGQVLEVYHSALNTGATVDQWPNNGSATQQWSLIPDGNAYHIVNRNSGLVLEILHSSTSSGATGDQWMNNETATQKWTLVPVTTTFYTITNTHSHQNVDVSGGSTSAGATIVQEPQSNTADQLWELVPDGNTYQLVNLRSGDVLEVYHSATNNGATVDQWGNNGSATQQWQLLPSASACLSGSACQLQNANSHLVLEVYYSSTSAGAKIDQWSDNGTATQIWTLTAI
jgi:hypothetical protein